MYYVYVLKSLKDTNWYIGCTGDLDNRIKMHNAGRVFSTKSRAPLELIYSEKFIDKYEAFKTEKFYKTAQGKKVLKTKIELV